MTRFHPEQLCQGKTNVPFEGQRSLEWTVYHVIGFALLVHEGVRIGNRKVPISGCSQLEQSCSKYHKANIRLCYLFFLFEPKLWSLFGSDERTALDVINRWCRKPPPLFFFSFFFQPLWSLSSNSLLFPQTMSIFVL